MHLNGRSVTRADGVTRLYVVVFAVAAVREFGNLIVVPCNVVLYIPDEVLRYYRLGANGELDTIVFKGADVGGEGRVEVRPYRYFHRVEEVFSLTIVSIDTTADAAAEEAVVDTYIVGRCSLPLQVGVVSTCTLCIIICVTESVLCVRVARCVECGVTEI